MAGDPNRILLPLIPLARDAVLFPGISLRIPLQDRPDIAALLSAIYNQAATRGAEPSLTLIGCVPLCSPLLSPEGQKLLEDSDLRIRKTAQHLADNPNDAKDVDMFAYGVTAKVVGVQGRRASDLVLVVEGLQRIRVERYTQFKPYIECEATQLEEEGAIAVKAMSYGANGQQSFKLKMVTRRHCSSK